MDAIQVAEIINEVTETYKDRRISELMSTTRGGSRISNEDIPSILSKAQTAVEIKALLYNAFGFDV